MRAPGCFLLAVVLLCVAGVFTFAVDEGSAWSCAGSVATVENVTTFDDGSVTATSAGLSGWARVSDNDEFRGWFQYRTVGSGGDWRTTNRTEVPTNSCGKGWFEASITGLATNTTYEYRAVAATDNDTARGDVRTFRTEPRGTTATTVPRGSTGATVTQTRTPRRLTRTPTPDPCPNFRGAGALCTRTPTPHEDPGVTPTVGHDYVEKAGPGRNPGVIEWIGGLLPMIVWVAALVVLTPLVLGGLIALDSLNGGE